MENKRWKMFVFFTVCPPFSHQNAIVQIQFQPIHSWCEYMVVIAHISPSNGAQCVLLELKNVQEVAHQNLLHASDQNWLLPLLGCKPAEMAALGNETHLCPHTLRWLCGEEKVDTRQKPASTGYDFSQMPSNTKNKGIVKWEPPFNCFPWMHILILRSSV